MDLQQEHCCPALVYEGSHEYHGWFSTESDQKPQSLARRADVFLYRDLVNSVKHGGGSVMLCVWFVASDPEQLDMIEL